MRLRLAIELVPFPIQFTTLHRVVKQSVWDRLRHKVYAAAGHRCKACGKGGRLNCHEVWKYDDNRGVARLAGFRALCPACHMVCHAADWLRDILPELEGFSLGRHWCKVNGRDSAAWARYYGAAYLKWEKRNRRRWRVDLGRWADLVPAEFRRGRRLLPRAEWPGPPPRHVQRPLVTPGTYARVRLRRGGRRGRTRRKRR